MSEDRKKIIAKLIKIKALAERGVGGEQATAQLMYDTLKKRYGITDEEVSRAAGGTVDITENVTGCAQCWTTKKARCLNLESVWDWTRTRAMNTLTVAAA